MARPFTEDERQRINAKIMTISKNLFSENGFQKTSIAKITQRAGIAQGTFYNFFQSKEALYFKILEEEEQKFHTKMLEIIETNEGSPKTVITSLLEKVVATAKTNKLIQNLYSDDKFTSFTKQISTKTLEDHFEKDTIFFTKLNEVAAQRGIIFSERPSLIASLIRSLFVLSLNKQAIGEKHFDETSQLLIKIIATNIIVED